MMSFNEYISCDKFVDGIPMIASTWKRNEEYAHTNMSCIAYLINPDVTLSNAHMNMFNMTDVLLFTILFYERFDTSKSMSIDNARRHL
jgi:hypothetical protein